ncbi:MAG: hypothetical protein QOG01_4354 [Pseudonocardiales bacterium]|nr:hypothetical protein [Pseudonocardiales bacterium]
MPLRTARRVNEPELDELDTWVVEAVHVAARRHRRLDQTDLPAGLLAGQLGRVDVAVE